MGDTKHLNSLWLHQDDLVLAIVKQISGPGSALYNGSPLDSAHPDYVTELFAERLGMPTGNKRVAVPANGGGVQATAAWILDKTPAAMDAELGYVRSDVALPDLHAPDTKLIAVRVNFNGSPEMTDTDGVLRFSPANVRLKAGAHDYYPVGTLVGGALILENRPDDPMMIDLRKNSQNVDFVFEVNADDDLKTTTYNKEKKVQFKDGSFVEVKRYAQSDLSGMELKADAPDHKYESAASVASNNILGGVLRKKTIATNALQKLTGLEAQQSNDKPAKTKGKGGAAAAPSSGGQKDNDLLPITPSQGMGF